MSDLPATPHLDPEGLRERSVPQRTKTADEARKAVIELNDVEEKSNKDEKDKKTFGRTPDGTGECYTHGVLAFTTLFWPASSCISVGSENNI